MALPRFFVPRASAAPGTDTGNPVALAIDTFAIDRAGAASEEWVVGPDDLGLLSVQPVEPADRLLPYVRSALAVREVSRGPARVLAAQSLHLFEVLGTNRTPDLPGLDDPVQLYGSLLGPLAPARGSEPLVRTEGQLTVSRGDILQALIAGADDAFVHVDSTTERSTRTMHMLLPGGRLEQLAKGCDLVLAYPALGAHADAVGPGNEILVAQILYELLTAMGTEAPLDASFSSELGQAVRDGGLPPLSLVLAALSPAGEQAARRLAVQLNASGPRPLWRSLLAENARVVPQLLAAAVDQATPAGAGGSILDDNAVPLRLCERLPRVLEFKVPEGTRAFTLVTNGKRYRQRLQ